MTTVINVNTTINLYFHFFRLLQGPMAQHVKHGRTFSIISHTAGFFFSHMLPAAILSGRFFMAGLVGSAVLTHVAGFGLQLTVF